MQDDVDDEEMEDAAPRGSAEAAPMLAIDGPDRVVREIDVYLTPSLADGTQVRT